ncbi:endopeptidase La [Wolinella succinogenes]|uniref:Lon protease n=1 Tax=Wolinella succinogenes (strain ATCC 29543 / DSM 1740 / CCUG 13145 / JCM 31913 / LMG 7466 / NCTC 11488 / FDC 602W) TaxID=273121 RepID=Q7M802_WOLSU|nr:endopeptidase La [Wolinella succinogenes]CAE10975.1 PUTATIVE ATP-DEPENDENT PROTEASE LA PROTEIN [Wolinella succinogenes]VEG81137.1 Lon protease 1 [Wolinella succinogenes]HCZ19031.1 endopeptidase La [Helicobacter sp.]
MQLSNYGSFPMNIPVVVEDDLFLYPFMIVPIFVNDEANIKAINHAMDHNELIFIATAKVGEEENRTKESFYPAGVVGSIMRKVALPDGRVKLLFQGLARGKVLEVTQENPLMVEVDLIKSLPYEENRINAVLAILRDKIKTLSSVNPQFPPDLLRTIEENHDPHRIIDLIASTIKLRKEQAYRLFIEADAEERLLLLIDYIIEEVEALKLQKEIKSKVHNKMEQINKEYFLKEQLKQIQKELGVDNQRDEEIEEYYEKLESLKEAMPKDAYKEIKKQIDRLSRMHPDSADANLLQNYVEWMLEIPFGKISTKKLSIDEVKKQLDHDHYSLKKPKERIAEYFAVRELLSLRGKDQKDSKGTILCFFGPPGVGKTSLANSIATALKRPLVRIALGGLEDVNELRGHRRTYIGAMPGRIVQGLIDAKEMNPVMVLDEIDKVGRSHRGDPTSVLLEILDPEQNSEFRDYYANFNIDLSQVIFIATANDIGQIPAPLRDRMEFIQVSSYTPQEKLEIAKKYLIPQEMKKHGLQNAEVSLSLPALREMIEKYTREAGVRNLRRRIAQILRKCARLILQEGRDKVSITPKNLPEFLDKIVFEIDEADKKDRVGVVNGLAWTSVGGDVLKIEAVKIKGKGALQLTGSLGDVMKESAKIALSVVKVLIDEGKIRIDSSKLPKKAKSKEGEEEESNAIYNCYDLHLHVPEGATPKDGPSAGIAMASVIASILSDKKVRSSVAMTGELTLTGKVLQIGGLKEKLIAAHKAGIKRALIPKKNFERDLDEIPDEVKEALEIVPVTRIEEVLKEVLI